MKIKSAMKEHVVGPFGNRGHTNTPLKWSHFGNIGGHALMVWPFSNNETLGPKHIPFAVGHFGNNGTLGKAHAFAVGPISNDGTLGHKAMMGYWATNNPYDGGPFGNNGTLRHKHWDNLAIVGYDTYKQMQKVNYFEMDIILFMRFIQNYYNLD